MKFRMICCVALVTLGLIATVRAEDEPAGKSLAEQTLEKLVRRQKELLADATKAGDKLDQSSFQSQMEDVCRSYELLLRDNPKFTAAYTSYGYLLGKLGQSHEAAVILLKANELDPNQPLVKNQLGNYLAEDGKPLDALPYYLSAIKLSPNEPLYHYQLGTLLYEARDDFLKSGEWKADAIDHAIHEAFKKAAELAPDRLEFTYRYAESFYDMATPDWPAALKEWEKLEAQATSDVERQTMRLHEANVLIKDGKPGDARAKLDTVTEPGLQKQKQKLIAQLTPSVDK